MMKKFSLILALFLFVEVFLPIHAKTVTISLSQKNVDITSTLKSHAKGLTPRDTLAVNLGKGKFFLAGTVKITAHVVITGKGHKKSFIECLDNNNFTDDCYLHVSGYKNRPVTVTVKDLNLSLAHHNDFWWDRSHQHYLLKIYHANRVDVSNIDSYMNNSTGTNLNLRVCSNVNITNCNLTNYNNNRTGGILWINGNTENVSVTKCKFHKCGNDEVIALFGNSDDAYKWYGGNDSCYKRNIFFDRNEFYFERGKDDEEMCTDVALSIFTQEGNETNTVNTILDNIRFCDNSITVDSEVKDLFMVRFDDKATHSGIVFDNNMIEYTEASSATNSFRVGFRCIDHSTEKSPIEITGNTLHSACTVLDNGRNAQTFLVVDGATVHMSGNHINTDITQSDYTANKRVGSTLMWFQKNGGKLTLENNYCNGLYALGNLSNSHTLPKVELIANKNFFEGCTSINCNNIDRLDLHFTENTFLSTKWEFFLVEFAKTGSIVFNHNTVNAVNKGGALLCKYKKGSMDDFVLEEVEIVGNQFVNVNQNDFLKNLGNIKKKTIKGNRF